MKYCSQCGAEYRQEVERCSECPDAGWAASPPTPGIWSAEEAGWLVVLAAQDQENLHAASELLVRRRLAHLLLERQPDGSYLPAMDPLVPGQEREAARPMSFEGWDENWILVVPRPMHAEAVAAVKLVENRDEGDEPHHEDGLRIPASTDASYTLPWEKPVAPVRKERKAFAVLLAGIIGFGSGLFLLRMYRAAWICLLLQLVILLPALPSLQPDPVYTYVHLIGRATELILAIRALIELEH